MFSNLKFLEWHRWRGLVAEGSTLRSIQDCGVSSLERFGSSVKRELERSGAMGCTWSGLHALTAAVSGGGGEIFIGKRRFRIQRQIGEGGFAFVYLVKELDEKPDDPLRSEDGTYAIKKFLIQSDEQRVLVKQEIEVSKLFDHPNLLHLLDSDVIRVNNEIPGSQEAYLLFPFHREGTLLDHLTRMQSEKKFFPTITVLYIFQQICAGLKHMHTHDPPYAHYDMKPGNVLLSLPRNKPPVAVIMDFGSAKPARKQIHSRKEALDVQEWASQHCTAPYRAPELWDTPSQTLLDERTDIWALGCTLYAIMYGMSPFEYALNEQGGSLHLAIISGVVKWPPGPSPPYPESLHLFVKRMVNPLVESRPYIQDVCLQVDELVEEFSGANKGGGLSMGRESMNPMGQSVHNSVSGARAPFTTGQWAELEHQALIFKYMMAGVSVPNELLNPIPKSVATMNGLASHHATNLGWVAFHLGVANNTDPEPGRCRRTDGKKWRCARDVVPDQKYCERHMHRGRHRSRGPVEGQTSSASQSGSATSSGPQPAIAVGASRTSTPTPGSSLTHSNLRPSILSGGNSQSTTNLGGGGMGYNSPGGSGALSGGSSPAASSGQFQLPGLSSATGTSGLTSKDYRYNMNGMTVKSEMGMNPEQILFSEASGSTRGLSQEAQSLSNLSRLNTTMNKTWQTMTSSKVSPSPQPKGSGNSSLLSYTSPQMGGLLGQDFGLMPETSQVNLAAMAASQQQHSFLSNGGYGGVETTSVGGGGRESSEGQPLRHFFADDWPPRSRADQSSLAWGSDVEDSDRATSNNAANSRGGGGGNGGQSNHTSNNTQLSISIPTTAAPSGDFNSQSSGGSPSRGSG